MRFVTFDTVVRNICSDMGDVNADGYIRIARCLQVVLEDLNILAFPIVRSEEFTIGDGLTVVLPDDCILPLQVGTLDALGRITLLGQEDRLRRVLKSQAANEVSCDNPDLDQDTSTTSTGSDVIFFNFTATGNYVGERYGKTNRQHLNGLWRYNKELNLIEFGSGYRVFSGGKVIIEYKASMGDDIHRMIHSEWQPAIKAKTMSDLAAATGQVRVSEFHHQRFLRAYQTLKRMIANQSPQQLRATFLESISGAAKW